jgi:maleamate amidohydrolase
MMAGLPVFYSTGDTRAASRPSFITATKRNRPPVSPSDYAIRPEFKPEPDDVAITKQRASVFFGTSLMAHLTQLGVQSLIICGESTSGCVPASAVDAHSNGLHLSCWLRNAVLTAASSPTIDMHHKYVDVMHLGDVIAYLEDLAACLLSAREQ